jgi:hypothetical protein
MSNCYNIQTEWNVCKKIIKVAQLPDDFSNQYTVRAINLSIAKRKNLPIIDNRCYGDKRNFKM